MTVLVTGGTGFIGSHLIRLLQVRGYSLRCLVRGTSRIETLGRGRLELFQGDVTDRKSLEGITKDIDVVYHLVGVGSVNAISESAYQRYRLVNVEGTRNLLDECLTNAPGHIVCFSSLAAVGVVPGQTVDENTPCRPSTPYERSKHESELLALDYWREHGLPVTVIRPPLVYGERAVHSEILRMCRMVKRHVFPTLGPGKNLTCLAYVGNVANGAILAGENPDAAGQVYIISDRRPYTTNELMAAIASALGIRFPGPHVPVWLASKMALLLEIAAALTGTTAILTRRRVRSATSNRSCSIEKAQQHLGYAPSVELRQGMLRTVRWYEAEGYL